MLTNLALVLDKTAKVADARDTYQQALRLAQDGQDKRQVAIIYGNMATTVANQSLEKALEYYGRALSLHREMGNRHLEGALLSNIATTHLNGNQLDEAETHYKQALQIHRENETKVWVGIILGGLGSLYRKRGNTDMALQHVLEAIEISRETGHLFFEGMMHVELGVLHAANNTAEASDTAFEQAEAILIQARDLRARAVFYHRRAQAEADQNRWTEAQISLDKARSMMHELSLDNTSDLGQKLLNIETRIQNAS